MTYIPMKLWLELVAGLVTFVVGILAILILEYFRTEQCPYCARGWAFKRRGRDLVCRRCARDIDRRIRALDDPPAKLRLLK